jgi:hypothetical protein
LLIGLPVQSRQQGPLAVDPLAVKDSNGGKRATLSEARKIIQQACHILTELGDDALTAA